MAVVVRDLANGKPVPNLDLRCAGEAGKLSTDDRGRIRVQPVRVKGLAPANGPWRLAGRQTAADGAVLWVYRMATLHITVSGTDGQDLLDPTIAELRVTCPGERGPPVGLVSTPPWTGRWLLSHGVLPVASLAAPHADGRATIEIPAVGGLWLTAHATGWRPASARLSFSEGEDHYPVELRLSRRAARIRGTVVGADGRPVGRANVVVNVSRNIALSEYSLEKYRRPEYAFGAVIDQGAGVVNVRWGIYAWTDAETGEFEVNVDVDGDVHLFILPPPEHGLFVCRLGELHSSIDGLRIELAKPEPETIAITFKGNPLPGADIDFGDRSYENFDPAFGLTADENGRIRTRFLERGREYDISVTWKGPPVIHRPGRLVWDGRSEIRVEELSR